MSELMLEAVLRMPPNLWSGSEIDVMQRHSRYVQAAEELASLKQQLAEAQRDAGWISVHESLPTPRQFVLIYYKKDGKPKITMGWHTPPKTVKTSSYWEEVDDEYDEETDTYYLKEVWVDESEESAYFYVIYDVTHWKPLPAPPIDQAMREGE